MFWNDPNLYGFSFPYKEFTTPQFPLMPQMNFAPPVPKWTPQIPVPFQAQYNYPTQSYSPYFHSTPINPLFLATGWNPYMHSYVNPQFFPRPFGF